MKNNTQIVASVCWLVFGCLVLALRTGLIKWDGTDKNKRATNPYYNTPYTPVIPPGGYQIPQTGFPGQQGPPGYAGGR